MTQKNYFRISGFLFLVVAFIHLLRLLMGWQMTVVNWPAPMWISVIGLIITGILGFYGLRFASQK